MVGILYPLTIHSEGDAKQNYPTPYESLSDNSTTEQIKEALVFTFETYGINEGEYSLLLSVIQCESGFSFSAIGDNGLAISLAQFHKPTFDMFNKIRGTDLDIYSAQGQVDMYAWAMANGYENHWSCWKKLSK